MTGKYRDVNGCGIESLESDPLAVDISLVHLLLLNSSFAGVFAGAAAERRAYLKVVESADLCRAHGWGFLPVVAETTGAGPRAPLLLYAAGPPRSA